MTFSKFTDKLSLSPFFIVKLIVLLNAVCSDESVLTSCGGIDEAHRDISVYVTGEAAVVFSAATMLSVSCLRGRSTVCSTLLLVHNG